MSKIKIPAVRKIESIANARDIPPEKLGASIQEVAKAIVELRDCCEKLAQAIENHETYRHR